MTPWVRTALILSWVLTFIAFLWLGSVTLSLAWSNRPTPSLGKGGHQNQSQGTLHQQDSAPEQRGTSRVPLIVRLEKTEEDREASKNDERRAETNANTDLLQAAFNGGLLIVGLLQLIILGVQIRIMVGQHATAKNDQRPWVGTREISLVAVLGSPIAVKVALLNSGKTPATKFGCRTVLLVTGDPAVNDAGVEQEGERILQTGTPVLLVIMPGEQKVSTALNDKILVTHALVDGIKGGQIRAYVYGDIQYATYGRKSGRTTFFMKFDHKADSFVGMPTHNDAT
jgi:hypothetical protein